MKIHQHICHVVKEEPGKGMYVSLVESDVYGECVDTMHAGGLEGTCGHT